MQISSALYGRNLQVSYSGIFKEVKKEIYLPKIVMKNNGLLGFFQYTKGQVKIIKNAGGIMIPSRGITSMYVKFAGEQSLLSIAQSNMIHNFDRISKTRTHTFLSNNAQTPDGISRNFGHDRFYCWEDTMINCQNNPSLVESDGLKNFADTLGDNPKFQTLKNKLEERLGGEVTVEPFVMVLRGQDNMRYNIRCESKVEDFDIIRVGLRLCADDEQSFKAALRTLESESNPFKMKPHVQPSPSALHSMA